MSIRFEADQSDHRDHVTRAETDGSGPADSRVTSLYKNQAGR